MTIERTTEALRREHEGYLERADTSSARSETRQTLTIYVALLTGLFALACVVTTVRRELLGERYPFDTFLLDPNIRFSDLLIFNPRFAVLGDGTAFFDVPGHPFTYPAPCVYAYLLFVRLTHPVLAYMLVLMTAVLAGAIVLVRGAPLTERGFVLKVVAITALFSYPFLALMDRANIEGLVWIVLCLGVVAFVREHFFLAAALFGVAAAMKLFPVFLFPLFVARRRYKALGVAVASCATVTLAALFAVGPTVAQAARGISRGLGQFGEIYALQLRPGELGFDHSLFSWLKWAMWLRHHDADRVHHDLVRAYLAYAAVVAIGFAALYVLRLRKLPIMNQLFALVVCMITLPFVSNDYTLIHLYLPWGVLIVTMVRDLDLRPLSRSHALAFLVPCAVLFTPQSYLFLGTMGWGGQVKTVALVALLSAAARIPIRSSLFGETMGETSA